MIPKSASCVRSFFTLTTCLTINGICYRVFFSEARRRNKAISCMILYNVLQWGWRSSQVVCLKVKLSIFFSFFFFNSRSNSNSYQELAGTTLLTGCISLYWFFGVGNTFCSHLNFNKEGRYECVVGTNNTDQVIRQSQCPL